MTLSDSHYVPNISAVWLTLLYNNNNYLFENQQNEWLVPQIVTKLIETGQDEYRNTLEKQQEITNTRHAKTLRSNRFKAFYTSLQNKSNNSKWND